MFEKLKDIETKYAEVEKALGDPAQISNQQRLIEFIQNPLGTSLRSSPLIRSTSN